MPKYIVKDTHISHGGKDDKVSTIYAPGDEIELTAKEAEKMMHHLEPVKEKKKSKDENGSKDKTNPEGSKDPNDGKE
jgi:hypothetical protein